MAAISPYHRAIVPYYTVRTSYNRIIPDNRSDWSGPLAPSGWWSSTQIPLHLVLSPAALPSLDLLNY
jgi:hypothetical protein